jgi:hypothetical protein
LASLAAMPWVTAQPSVNMARCLAISSMLLLAHGAPQDVGAAQGVACQDLGGLHDLLLVDDDAVGLLQDGLQGRVRVAYRLAAELAVHELGYVVHGTRDGTGRSGL